MSNISSPPHASPYPDDPNARRSSSLSDIMDAADQDDPTIPAYSAQKEEDPNDTEAETERLEDSPFKRQEQLSVVFASANVDRSQQNVAHTRSSSEASSLGASSDDDLHRSPAASPSRKRKASHNDAEKEMAGPLIENSPPDRANLSRSGSPQSVTGRNVGGDHELPQDDELSESDSASATSSAKAKDLHGSRKAKLRKLDDGDELGDAEEEDLPLAEERGDEPDAENIDLDDGEGFEVEEADPDISSKSQEEIANKRSALDSLTSLEKCFATLRDKLFDERLAAANAELSLLQKPDFLHAELSAMRDAIDKHRQRKIQYQQKFLKHKLQTLQRESIAEKHQVQSQYMQTAREARDHALDKLNEDFYQVQRERRKGDSAMSDAMYTFNNDRTRQIRQQTAYNKEISIVSGFAKYVGFPAAPAIQEARPEEVEEDMRSMGIAPQTAPLFPNQYNFFRSTPLAQVPLNRQTPTAEENFLERNAWANPQHPAHLQRLQMHRQRSNQPTSNSITPTASKGGGIGPKSQLASSSIADQPSDGLQAHTGKLAMLQDGGRPGDVRVEDSPHDYLNPSENSAMAAMSQKEIYAVKGAAHQSNTSRDRVVLDSSEIPTHPSLVADQDHVRDRFDGNGCDRNAVASHGDGHRSRSPGQLRLNSPGPAAIAGAG